MPRPGQAVALVAGVAQVLAGFLAWTGDARVGLDVAGPVGPTIALTMVLLAALPLVWLLVGDRGWPRVAGGTATALVVVLHLATGPDGVAATGVLVATWAAIGQWLAAALATGPFEVPRLGD